MKKNLSKQQITVERFNPTESSGLSSVQVKSRIDAGLTNATAKKYSKSYLSIFVGNICTFFNLLGLIVCIALITVNAGIFDFVFVLV